MSDFQLPDPEPYTGMSGGMSMSKWLRGEDIPQGKVVPATAESVLVRRGVRFRAEDEPSDIYSLRLADKSKELKITSTIRKTLTEWFGADTRNWIGKSFGITTIMQMIAGKRMAVIDVVRLPEGVAPPSPAGNSDIPF